MAANQDLGTATFAPLNKDVTGYTAAEVTALVFGPGGSVMGFRHTITDADWERVRHLLPGPPGQHGGVAEDNRRFLDAILWVARTGAAWRDLPERLGLWNS